MIKILIIIAHVFSNANNAAQITALSSVVVATTTASGYDGYAIPNAARANFIQFVQAVPPGGNPPSNWRNIRSADVVYAASETVGRPRFFNWGIKQALAADVDVAIVVESASNCTASNIQTAIGSLVGSRVYVEDLCGKYLDVRQLKARFLLDESLTYSAGVTALKDRLTQAGYSVQ